MLTLYQFPISHYCEKVRWALDFKRLEHRQKNLLPGLHLRTTRKLVPASSVPILQHDDRFVQGSSQIVDYLDETFPERPLTPSDPALEAEAREWESYVDEELGVHIRRAAYHVLLDHKEVVLPFFTHRGPWYGPVMLRFMFPRLRVLMRQRMKIAANTAEVSRGRAEAALERTAARLRDHEFLVGDSFSRADLAAASLAAPMCKPPAYGLPWPDRWPSEMQEWVDSNADRLQWVDRLYEGYRNPS